MKLPRRCPVELSTRELQELLQFAQCAADAARLVTTHYFRQPMRVDNKAGPTGFDPVTVADREAELAIREILRSQCPQIGFFGEEHEAIAEDQPLMWIVDPIDGTRAYMSGMPLWGTLIGLYNGEKSVLGIMDQPILNERYVGFERNARLLQPNDAQDLVLQTRQESSLHNAVAYCTTPDMFVTPASIASFESLKQSVRLMRYGGDCYAYTLLASGHVDIVVDCDLQPYDIAALIPIIEAAGGVVSNWAGGAAIDGGYVIACGSQELHAKALQLLNVD